MTDHYAVLGLDQNASLYQIKQAFREKAKQLHPDIAGVPAGNDMRKLIESYEVLSNRNLRAEYDKLFYKPPKKNPKEFNYREFLKEHSTDAEYKAKLIFFDIFHFEEEEAVAIWQAAGGLKFQLEKFLDREDWMDCGFVLAEELERDGFFYEAFLLSVQLLKEERRKPYFRHFAEDLELFIKNLVRNKLRRVLSVENWIICLERLLYLGFSCKDEARWLKQIAAAHKKLKNFEAAEFALKEAVQREND
ncbi:MAG: J domain-containing protein [Spirochaetaceae bacterium]|jgi:curved DNA-binding protein CbpA|nr:J domain-containing protein [Spirochaetaceae bacterium]GMO19976.1 MAG: DnaJ domain-containing protein [Termitinemataceae bacterium]